MGEVLDFPLIRADSPGLREQEERRRRVEHDRIPADFLDASRRVRSAMHSLFDGPPAA